MLAIVEMRQIDVEYPAVHTTSPDEEKIGREERRIGSDRQANTARSKLRLSPSSHADAFDPFPP